MKQLCLYKVSIDMGMEVIIIYSFNINNSRSINEVFKNSAQSPSEISYESGFIDLLNVHDI